MLYIMQSILYRNDVESAERLLNEMSSFINLLPSWEGKPKDWLIAHPSETIIALTPSGINAEAIGYLDEVIAKKTSVSIALAGEGKDESPIILWFKNTPAIAENRYSLTLAVRSPQQFNDKTSFLNVLLNMTNLEFWKCGYIYLETEQYRMEQRFVFEDRLPAGWMLYLPEIIEHSEVPSALEVINLSGTIGSLIITKNEFDGKNENDIICANNVEIELAANGHLPKWLDI